MSIRYQILKVVYKHMGTEKLFGLPEKELFAKAAKYNKGRDFAVPKDKACVYTDMKVGETAVIPLVNRASETRRKSRELRMKKQTKLSEPWISIPKSSIR